MWLFRNKPERVPLAFNKDFHISPNLSSASSPGFHPHKSICDQKIAHPPLWYPLPAQLISPASSADGCISSCYIYQVLWRFAPTLCLACWKLQYPYQSWIHGSQYCVWLIQSFFTLKRCPVYPCLGKIPSNHLQTPVSPSNPTCCPQVA